MTAQKQSVVELVQGQRAQGRTVAEVLGSLGVARSSYYRWKKGEAQRGGRRHSPYEVSAASDFERIRNFVCEASC